MHRPVNETISERWKCWCWCDRDELSKTQSWLNLAVMKDTPDHLLNNGLFKIQDVIDGLLKALPLGGKKWNLPVYKCIVAHFREVSGLDREALKNMQYCKQILSNRLHRTCVRCSFLFLYYCTL